MSHGATDKHFIQRSPERGAQTRGSVCEVTVCGAPRLRRVGDVLQGHSHGGLSAGKGWPQGSSLGHGRMSCLHRPPPGQGGQRLGLACWEQSRDDCGWRSTGGTQSSHGCDRTSDDPPSSASLSSDLSR